MGGFSSFRRRKEWTLCGRAKRTIERQDYEVEAGLVRFVRSNSVGLDGPAAGAALDGVQEANNQHFLRTAKQVCQPRGPLLVPTDGEKRDVPTVHNWVCQHRFTSG